MYIMKNGPTEKGASKRKGFEALFLLLNGALFAADGLRLTERGRGQKRFKPK